MYHKLIGFGYLGTAPEKRFTPQGKAVTNFSVAFKNEDKTMWMNCVCFDRLAEICYEYLEKGSFIYVEGRLRTGEGGNPIHFKKQNGEYGTKFEMILDNVKFLPNFNKEKTNQEDLPF